jgi:hypothetical protein
MNRSLRGEGAKYFSAALPGASGLEPGSRWLTTVDGRERTPEPSSFTKGAPTPLRAINTCLPLTGIGRVTPLNPHRNRCPWRRVFAHAWRRVRTVP